MSRRATRVLGLSEDGRGEEEGGGVSLVNYAAAMAAYDRSVIKPARPEFRRLWVEGLASPKCLQPPRFLRSSVSPGI